MARQRPALLLFGAVAALAWAAAAAGAQIPARFTNLKVLPADITRDSLVQIMRGFTFATGLRCDNCHVMGENNSFQGAKFDLDDKERKRKARYMLEMTKKLNGELLPGLPGRTQPALAVECKTCHRGINRPYTLRTELYRVLHEKGTDAAIARYRELRETEAMAGVWDFGEWEVTELARQVAAEGNNVAAIALLELNEEFHSTSSVIPTLLGGLYEQEQRRDDAIAAYRRALERDPRNAQARSRLQALTGGG